MRHDIYNINLLEAVGAISKEEARRRRYAARVIENV